MRANFLKSKGFTLIELIVSLAILAVLFAIITMNISPIPSNTLVATNTDTLISDIRSQQTLAMTNNSSYGIHFDTGSYTLFTGSSYVAGSASNFVVTLDDGITFSNISFPNSALIFDSGTGEVNGYVSGSDTVTLASSITGKSVVIKINKYGATY